MTDFVQINTLDEELEWEEWKGVCNAVAISLNIFRTFLSGDMRRPEVLLALWST